MCMRYGQLTTGTRALRQVLTVNGGGAAQSGEGSEEEDGEALHFGCSKR